MPLIMHIGNLSSGHDSCESVPSVEGTPLFDVNDQPVTLVGHKYQDHGCPAHPTHTPIQSEGSDLVDVNGIPVAIVGKKIADGGCTSAHVCAVGDPLVDIEH